VSSRHGQPVFIVDDDPEARDALTTLFRAAGHRVDAFANAEEFIGQCGDARSGCVVLDARLPGMSGLELQQWLGQRNSKLAVVFCSGHGDIAMAVRAVKAGASDFLQKPVDERQLLAAVDAARTHDAAESSPAEALPAAVAALSRREREVLELILAGRQTRAIAGSLFISVKTVEFHRSRIHAKLGVTSLASLFNLCLGRDSRAARPARPHS
jgi:two-component system, LuxR family, response regulator FixJ